ncbi:hypothetical protein [Anaeromyxobacter dehalogenans]|uniref:Uncharacterized protein n=1 Tax=Anaeromyxobacter dehalogenans (strain 2CP-C) TaxID=290397 RepID=Q2IIU4_ANADE|nr:hypothetical protein [Anaeromyxobacter dehalogenans]ABC81571.1 hypothetical protein Adeh_1798 [Anaeromyxobacter dehalogenans 2CP-C]
MTRPLAEIEKQATLQRTRDELVAKLNAGGITADQAAIDLERLHAIHDELDALKPAPPAPPPPVLPDVGKLSRSDAAAKAAEIRKRPEYFTGRRADGTRLAPDEYEHLIREHAELNARAQEE